MKKLYPIILLVLSLVGKTYAQCTGCTQTISTGTALNLNATAAADVFCITGTVGIDGINNLAPGDKICVAPGATLNLGQFFSLGINGATATAFAEINVSAGATVNYAGSGGTGGFKINNSGTFNFTSSSAVSLIGNGGAKQEFNNLAGGVLNALATPNITWGQGAATTFNNAGTINANNIELVEAANPTNSATGVINVKRTFYIHSFGFTDNGKINTTCTATGVTGADNFWIGQAVNGCGLTVGDKGPFSVTFGASSCNVITGATVFNGPVIESGYFSTSTDLTINKAVTGTGGSLVVLNGVSTISTSGSINNATLKFYDVNTTNGLNAAKVSGNAHGFDVHQGNGSHTFTIAATQPANPCLVATVTISGKVFNDPNGDAVMNGTETPTNAGGVYANLVDATGKVVASVLVDPVTGAYSFQGTPSTAYSIILTPTSQTPGSTLTTSSLPTDPGGNWVNTGTNTGAPNTGNKTGIISITTPATGNLSGQDFAIEQGPVATSSTMSSQSNTGFTLPIPPTQFQGTDNNGVDHLTITSLPANAQSITVGGTKYGPGFTPFPPAGIDIPVDAQGNPTVSIGVQPFLGNNTPILIPYTATDSAGVVSAPATVTVPFSLILPVIGLELKVSPTNNCGMSVNWQTLTEINTRQFVVEYSLNGSSWTSVGVVNARGNSNGIQLYNLLHASPVRGANFYRIKAIDKDGQSMYSNSVQVISSCNGKLNIAAYPNPVRHTLTVSGVEAGSKIEILDAAGKVINKQTATGGNAEKVITSMLAQGMYILRVTAPDGIVTTIKVNKQQ